MFIRVSLVYETNGIEKDYHVFIGPFSTFEVSRKWKTKFDQFISDNFLVGQTISTGVVEPNNKLFAPSQPRETFKEINNSLAEMLKSN